MWRYPRELLLSIITLSTCHACITNEKEKVTKSDWGNKTYKLKVYFCRGHSLQYLQTAHNYYISPYNMAGESARKKKDEVNAVFWLATREGKPWTYLLSDEEFLPINIAKTTQQNYLLPSVFDHVFIRFRSIHSYNTMLSCKMTAALQKPEKYKVSGC